VLKWRYALLSWLAKKAGSTELVVSRPQ